MKRVAWILAVACLFGCKARQTATVTKDSTSTHKSTDAVLTHLSRVDTSKTASVTNSAESKTVHQVATDSAVTDAKPIPGTQTTINKDGSITGQFSDVKTTKRWVNLLDENSNKSLEHIDVAVKGINLDSLQSQKKESADSIAVKKSDHTTVSKANNSYVYVVFGILIIVAIAVFIYIKYFGGSILSFTNLFKGKA